MHAPSHYVSALYHKHAPEFEHRLVTTLGYNAARLLVRTHALTYTLAPSGRYQHDTNAIVELASEFGFNCLVKHSFDLRKERDQQIIGDLFVFQAS